MKKFKIALLGFGNAGQAFAEMLEQKRSEINKIYRCDPVFVAIVTGSRGSLVNEDGVDIKRGISSINNSGSFDADGKEFSQLNAIQVASTIDYDVLIEATPLNIFTGQPAIDHIRAALKRGRHAITANKGPIAWACKELENLAEENKVRFYYETTVMDGTPVFNLVEETLPLCKVTEVKGILNSTTNYILEEMTEGKSIDTILDEGRRRGFVEADPSMDIDGWDAAAKTAALLNVLMKANINPLEIHRKGIRDITYEDIRMADAKGCVIKLLCHGRLEEGKVVGEVYPCEIDKNDLYTGIRGTSSIVSITTDLMGTLSIVEHEPEIQQTGYGLFCDLIRIMKGEI